ncbi:uncharacterized protein LOC121875931 [Homarus americanus]|uniref:uncharacterized protein LOC121875931 n=1 Tax=Homarus americanus TaxID=6706 RepID=UPI001C45A727|nr:uncharacterized protein LOC121875931 [Homarus americanus]
MCELTGLKATGVVMAMFATLVSMGTEGFYAWKAYEVDNECNVTNVDNGIDYYNIDVCWFDELEVRTYIGLVEGILGIIVSVCLIIGFANPYLPLVWIWTVWALGISAYNSYCTYDYYTTIQEANDDPLWDIVWDVDYGLFFFVAMVSVCCQVFILIFVLPLGVAISCMISSSSSSMGGFECK